MSAFECVCALILKLLRRSFAHIAPRLDVPVRTIIFTFVFNVLFGLLYLGPTVAFSAYVASCTIFLNVSYAFPVITLIIRGRGVLSKYQNEQTYFNLGKSGLVVNYIASIFVVVTSVVSCTVGKAKAHETMMLIGSSSSAFPQLCPSVETA